MNNLSRITGKWLKYSKVLWWAILWWSDEYFRLVNFSNDLKESFLQKTINYKYHNRWITQTWEDIKENIESLLFNKVNKDILQKNIEHHFPEDWVYSLNTMVSCVDKKRQHPHAFVIEKTTDSYCIYFLDPEFSIGKFDTFSPMIVNWFKLNRDKYNKEERWIHIIRITNKERREELIKLDQIYSLLKYSTQENILENYMKDILLNCEYKTWILKSTQRDEKKLSPYTKAKMNSTWYILSTLNELVWKNYFWKVWDPVKKITFNNKLWCEK